MASISSPYYNNVCQNQNGGIVTCETKSNNFFLEKYKDEDNSKDSLTNGLSTSVRSTCKSNSSIQEKSSEDFSFEETDSNEHENNVSCLSVYSVSNVIPKPQNRNDNPLQKGRFDARTSDYSSLSSCNSKTSYEFSHLKQHDESGNFYEQYSEEELDFHHVNPNEIYNADVCLIGGCMKGGPKTTNDVHVQFESPTYTDSERASPSHSILVSANGKITLKKLSPSIENGISDSSLKKTRKKRRHASGSSNLSICSSSTSTSESHSTEFERRAPDGGWGWVVVFASFMVHCIADGVTMSFGVLYTEFLSYFKESKSMTSWVGSLFMAIPLLAGPLASHATDRYGCRTVTIWGAVIACIGFFLSAFSDYLGVLFLTTGIITGLGLAVCYVAAIVIVAFYFEKKRSLATGIAVAGSGIGTFLFAPIIQYFIDEWGWRSSMILLSGIFLNMAVCGSLMRELPWTKRKREQHGGSSQRHSGSHLSGSFRLGNNVTPAIPSLDELKRLIHNGETVDMLSPCDEAINIPRSTSLIVLPTFINGNKQIPPDLLSCFSTQINTYEVACKMYPDLLSSSLSNVLIQEEILEKAQGPLQHQNSIQEDPTRNIPKYLKRRSSSYQEALSKEACNAFKTSLKQTFNVKHAAEKSGNGNCTEFSNPFLTMASPLRNVKMNRHSMTYRGAMLNIHRYRLRASSCPDIYRDSITAISEEQNQSLWSCLRGSQQMIRSCLNMEFFSDISYIIFALSNFILYMFYDTVYMYLTDYTHGVGISADDSADLISAIGILNCIGMIIMGYIGDRPWSSPLIIYSVSMVICGASVIVIPLLSNYWLLASASASFGLFISANYALTAVILVDIISLEAFSKSYGLLLLIQGIANLIGPPLVGFMADTTGSYLVPFVISGVFIMICGAMLLLIPALKKPSHSYSRPVTKLQTEEEAEEMKSLTTDTCTASVTEKQRVYMV